APAGLCRCRESLCTPGPARRAVDDVVASDQGLQSATTTAGRRNGVTVMHPTDKAARIAGVFLNSLNDVAALVLVRGADFLSAFEKPQRDSLAMLFPRRFSAPTSRFPVWARP